ncbi:MAG: shikimate dehydrogenase [Candidatus Latescibacteria bacterium]|nr:shikimate dehydrogenase [Candidatus Latescibacterota bacterium]
MKDFNGSTAVYGIIGDPVEHSISPFMQTSAMEKMGFNGVYLPFHVLPEHLEKAIGGMKALNISGLNVTSPHKQNVIRYLDRISDAAEVIGAVNTIVNDSGALYGDNTDVYGYIQGVLKMGKTDVLPEIVCIFGAGGAARGVIYGCAMREEVRKIFIMNRTLSKAQIIADEFSRITGKHIMAFPSDDSKIRDIVPATGLVINTTTIGQLPDAGVSPVPDPSVFHKGQIVSDIITAPVKTKYLRDAEERGALTVNGLPMLAYQGARSLSIWTGMDAPEDYMLTIVRKHFDES